MHDQSARINVQKYTVYSYNNIYTCLLYAAWANVDDRCRVKKKLSIRFVIVRQSENIALVLNRQYFLRFTSDKKFKNYSILFDGIGDREVRIIKSPQPSTEINPVYSFIV